MHDNEIEAEVAFAHAYLAEGAHTDAMKAAYDWAHVLRALIAADEERVKLRDFKAYVHERLDRAGVPKDPPGEHSDAGCRVGQRLDLVLGDVTAPSAVAVTKQVGDMIRDHVIANMEFGPLGYDGIAKDVIKVVRRVTLTEAIAIAEKREEQQDRDNGQANTGGAGEVAQDLRDVKWP